MPEPVDEVGHHRMQAREMDAGVARGSHRAHSLEATALGVTFILGVYSSTAISRGTGDARSQLLAAVCTRAVDALDVPAARSEDT